ncbi:hypothetical protein CWN98_12565 [Vibrio splendidus]|uniref:haloacid dehalogenase-like hydrolase n=1 Tax=Vibrio splendidus TaxID=29497 RepID=UPI000D37FE71|nr:haloacid dehalogenase-like hydrolase [Vibrio splendidus]PTO86898.1 hypothetical protein CWN98_12565 [Vibrio splendidus]PTP47537.1 hypothetical protein CWO10_12030 [Vibrio splendidus]
MTKNNEVSIFDICGTLFFSNTTFDFIVFFHKKKKNTLKWLYSLLLTSFLGKILNRLSILNVRNTLLWSLKGESRSCLIKVANDFYDEKLIYKKNYKAFCILDLQLEQTNVILSSASIEPVVYIIANRLGVDYYASELEYDGNWCFAGVFMNDNLGVKDKAVSIFKVKTVVTDNLSDVNLCLRAENVVVFSKKKNANYWKKNLKDIDSEIIIYDY